MSGDPDTVHQAGISVRGRVGACESKVPDEELENWIVAWPGRLPKAAAKPAGPKMPAKSATLAKSVTLAKPVAPSRAARKHAPVKKAKG